MYLASSEVPAAQSVILSLDGLLRDILPDQPFRVHALVGYLQSSLEAGDALTVALAKNVRPITTWVLEKIAVQHGLIAELAMVKVVAAGTKESLNFVVPLPEPLDFDQNDSLNMEVTATNTAATMQTAYVSLSLEYEAG